MLAQQSHLSITRNSTACLECMLPLEDCAKFDRRGMLKVGPDSSEKADQYDTTDSTIAGKAFVKTHLWRLDMQTSRSEVESRLRYWR